MAYTEAQKRATAKYNAKAYDRVEFKIKKGNKKIIEIAAKKEGKSLNNYVAEAVDKQLIIDGNPSILDNAAPLTPEQPKEKKGIEKLIETLEDMQRQ